MWWTGAAGPATLGVGQQMSALNVFNANMVKFMSTTVTTANDGGTSQGNPDAGTPSSDQLVTYVPREMDMADFVGLPRRQREIKLLRRF
jgi:hypothetical protein